MRLCVAVLVGLACVAGASAQKAEKVKAVKRYGVEPDLESYPQKTPKDTLASVIKTMEARRIDYLMAQLADPEYVDERVQQVYKGRFRDLVDEATAKLAEDPGVIKKLRRFLDEGQWETAEATATAQLKDVPERVYLRKADGRWFFENRDRPKGNK
jgi:hypothetical protein